MSRLVRIVVLVLWVVTGGACGRTTGPDRVDGPRARELVQAGARLVDVRTPAEFAERRLPGAVNIPVGELAARLGELEPKNHPVVLYCRSGRRSQDAARQLRQAGFESVYDLGPIGAW
jgi:phage shock protein E